MTTATISGILSAPEFGGLDPASPAARLIDIIEQLTNLIGQEIGILQDRMPRDIASIQGEKARLETMYREEYATIKRQPELLGADDSPARLRLRAVSEAFNEILIKLGRILLRKRAITEGIVKSVADEVDRHRPKVGNYSATATLPTSKFAPAKPLSFDQSI